MRFGLYLSLHGAMNTVGTSDPEAEFIRIAREMVGVYHYTGSGRFVDRALSTKIAPPCASTASRQNVSPSPVERRSFGASLA